MKISKRSWHYKLHKFVRQPLPERAQKPWDLFKPSMRSEPTLPKSLCGYFWLTLAMAVLYVPIMVLLAAAAIVVGVGYLLIYLPIVRPIISHKERKRDELRAAEDEIWKRWTDGRITAAERDRLLDELYEGTKKQKQPGLLRQFVRASKRKVCPLIEVADE